jgi:hypothetical protein
MEDIKSTAAEAVRRLVLSGNAPEKGRYNIWVPATACLVPEGAKRLHQQLANIIVTGTPTFPLYVDGSELAVDCKNMDQEDLAWILYPWQLPFDDMTPKQALCGWVMYDTRIRDYLVGEILRLTLKGYTFTRVEAAATDHYPPPYFLRNLFTGSDGGQLGGQRKLSPGWEERICGRKKAISNQPVFPLIGDTVMFGSMHWSDLRDLIKGIYVANGHNDSRLHYDAVAVLSRPTAEMMRKEVCRRVCDAMKEGKCYIRCPPEELLLTIPADSVIYNQSDGAARYKLPFGGGVEVPFPLVHNGSWTVAYDSMQLMDLEDALKQWHLRTGEDAAG